MKSSDKPKIMSSTYAMSNV